MKLALQIEILRINVSPLHSESFTLQQDHAFNPPMVEPFWLTYLAGGEGLPPLPLEILTIACLTFCLLLTDRPTLGLPEYKLKVVNICKMHGTGGLEVVVL